MEFLNNVYKMALNETSKEFIDIVDLKKELITNADYNSIANAYKEIYYKIKFLDSQVKQFHVLTEDYEMLRFKLITIYKGLFNILHRDYDISQINVDEKTDTWMFIV